MDAFEFEMNIMHVIQTMTSREKQDKVRVSTTTQLTHISSKDYQYISMKYNIEFILCPKSNQLFIKFK